MPFPPILALNGFTGATNRQVYELSGGVTPTQIGNDITVAPITQNWPTSNGTPYNHSGFAKTFKNERYCVCLRADTFVSVRRENEGGSGVWGEVSPSTTGTNNDCAGLHIVKDTGNNDIALVTVLANGAANLEVGVSNTGQSGSWTWTVIGTPSAVHINSSSVVFRNRIYFTTLTNEVYEVDPIAGTASRLTAPWTSSSSVDFCVAFDKLYAVAADLLGVNGNWALYEFSGGSFAFVQDISNPTSAGTPSLARAKPCLWTDNTNLYLMAVTQYEDTLISTTFYGSSCWQGVPVGGGMYTWTQDDDTVPIGIRVGTNRGAAGIEDRWSIYVDNDTDPTDPAYYLVVVEGLAPGSGHTVYRWEGFGNEMGSGVVTGETGPGPSVATTFGFPEVKHGGAEAISQPVASYPEIVDDEPIPGGYRLYYRVWGVETGLTGRVYFSTEQGPPDTLATLIGGGTTINSVSGDSGVSLRQVDIDLGLSGISGPDNSTWMIKLE